MNVDLESAAGLGDHPAFNWWSGRPRPWGGEDRGLETACWGDITGSAIAAEVRIDGVKATEATAELLDGPPITIPELAPTP